MHFPSFFLLLNNVKVLVTPSNLYYAAVAVVLLKALSLPAEHTDTRRGVLFCMLFRIAPAVLYYLGWVQSESLLNVVCDGLIVSVITTDLAVARMARRPLHPWVWLFAMASVISYMAIVGAVVAYYLLLFFELTSYMKLPMFTMLINVYVDGVYDCEASVGCLPLRCAQSPPFAVCHVGHHNIFMAALQHGNRLFVGVLSDESVEAYKRRPVMTMAERVQVVATCKGVFKATNWLVIALFLLLTITGDSERSLSRHSGRVSAQAQHPHCVPVDRVRQARRQLLRHPAQAGNHARAAAHRGNLHL